jgi:hypothetical protein
MTRTVSKEKTMAREAKEKKYPKTQAVRFHTGVHALNTVLTSVDSKRNQCELEFDGNGVWIIGSNTYKFVANSNIIDVTFERD